MLPHKHKLILYIFNKRLYSHRRSFFFASLEFVCVTQPSCQFPENCAFDSHSTLNKKVHEAFLASFACKVFTQHYSGLVQLAARPSLMASSRPEKLDSEIQMVWLKASDRLFAQSSSMLCLLFPNVFCWFLKDEYIWNLKVKFQGASGWIHFWLAWYFAAQRNTLIWCSRNTTSGPQEVVLSGFLAATHLYHSVKRPSSLTLHFF